MVTERYTGTQFVFVQRRALFTANGRENCLVLISLMNAALQVFGTATYLFKFFLESQFGLTIIVKIRGT